MPDEFGLLADRELQEIIGRKVDAKWVFALVGDRLFHRVTGGWLEYPASMSSSSGVAARAVQGSLPGT